MSRGAALSELVILAPLILLLLIGVVEAGAAGNFAIKIGNAARAGVQYGAQNHVTAADTNGMVGIHLRPGRSMPHESPESLRAGDGLRHLDIGDRLSVHPRRIAHDLALTGRRDARRAMRRRSGERGAVLAEFAISGLAALTLMLGTIDYARLVYTQHLVTDGARYGTRYAVVHGVASCAGGSPDPLQAYVSGLAPGITPSLMTVTTTCPGGNTGCTSTASPYNGTGCVVNVNVKYTFTFIVPLISLLTIPLSSSSQMVISQ